jgi:hypothetical protein
VTADLFDRQQARKRQDSFSPVPLFPAKFVDPARRGNYNVAPDGRFLVNFAVSDQTTAPITVVMNWAASLKK